MSDEIVVRETAVDVPGAGRFLRREYLTPQGESLKVEYLPVPNAEAAGIVLGIPVHIPVGVPPSRP